MALKKMYYILCYRDFFLYINISGKKRTNKCECLWLTQECVDSKFQFFIFKITYNLLLTFKKKVKTDFYFVTMFSYGFEEIVSTIH